MKSSAAEKKGDIGPYAACVPVAARSPDGMLSGVDRALAAGADLAEARLDFMGRRSAERALDLLSAGAEGRRRMGRLVCTVRAAEEGGSFRGSARERTELLALAAWHRPRLLDVEYGTLRRSAHVRDAAADSKTDVLASWHDLSGTPPLRSLEKRLEGMSEMAPYAKIVTTAAAPADPARVLCLYGSAERLGRRGRGGNRAVRLVAFAMGDMGRMSRVLCLYLGSPYTYASLGRAVAPGQMGLDRVRSLTERARAEAKEAGAARPRLRRAAPKGLSGTPS